MITTIAIADHLKEIAARRYTVHLQDPRDPDYACQIALRHDPYFDMCENTFIHINDSTLIIRSSVANEFHRQEFDLNDPDSINKLDQFIDKICASISQL